MHHQLHHYPTQYRLVSPCDKTPFSMCVDRQPDPDNMVDANGSSRLQIIFVRIGIVMFALYLMISKVHCH